MARRVVRNEPSGETFVFDDDWNEPNGRVRQLEYALDPKKRVPPHAHPGTAQGFEVLSGVLTIQVGKTTRTLKPGESAATGAGQMHAQWNDGAEVVRVIERYDPPLAIEPLFTAIPAALASRNPFKIAVLFVDFRQVTEIGSVGMRIFIRVFGALGHVFGLGGWYKPLLGPAGPPFTA